MIKNQPVKVNPKYGLLQGLPSPSIYDNCDKMFIYKPRSTFCSMAWMAKCKEYFSLLEVEFLEELRRGSANYLWAPYSFIDNLETHTFDPYELIRIWPWFDSDGEWSAALFVKRNMKHI